MTYHVVVSEQVKTFLSSLTPKSKRICKKNILKLSSPFPGKGAGDKEKLHFSGEDLYRLHISRSFTALYIIDSDDKIVRVIELLTIEKAHKKYRFF